MAHLSNHARAACALRPRGAPQRLRVPATTDAHKVANVRTIFDALARFGVALGDVRAGLLSAEDIIYGHREKTLGLLWRVILHWQVDRMLSEATLQDEVTCLRHVVARHRKLQSRPGDLLDLDEQLNAVRGDARACAVQPLDAGTHCARQSGCHCAHRRQALVSYFQAPKLSLLLQWCQAVCALANLPVQNFSASFSDGMAPSNARPAHATVLSSVRLTPTPRRTGLSGDLWISCGRAPGRALCYLINYYYPSLLPLSAIQTTTSRTRAAAPAVEEEDFDENIVDGRRVRRAVAMTFSPGALIEARPEPARQPPARTRLTAWECAAA